MPRSANAQLAVDLYRKLAGSYGWTVDQAWKGIALLLLTCEVWDRGWSPFHSVVVYRERNDFKIGRTGPNKTLRKAENLSLILARDLGIDPAELCQTIAQYWREPRIRILQPHNLVGHAFRSIVVAILEDFGNPHLQFEEEVDPYLVFPGHPFSTRSENARIDIVVYRRNAPVALMSARWRFRHDRVDVVDEAIAYAPATIRARCEQFAVVGEFSPNRLTKILTNCQPSLPTAALAGCIHFAPHLITEGLGENGRTTDLQNLEWLVRRTLAW